MKTLIMVVLISILIGVGIFLAGQLLKSSSSKTLPILNQITGQSFNKLPSPTPAPKPTPPPIGPDSNLEEEINKLTPPDFSVDIEQLKKQL